MNDEQAKHTPLHDAVKELISMRGYCILQWGFTEGKHLPEHSIQVPEDVADQILLWRNSHDQLVEALKKLHAELRGYNPTDIDLSETETALRAAGVEL